MEQFIAQNWWLIAITIIWSAAWKAIALYMAARLEQKVWFGALFILNTFGILEILYIFYFSKTQIQKQPAKD